MGKQYDLVVIGGGAAGIMSAISAKRSKPELSVCIIDRTYALGRKILVCGAGRCNITNVNLDKQIENRFYSTIKTDLIKNIFSKFGLKDIENFFHDLGIELYVERKTNIGKVFPITDQAKTVTVLLESELKRLGVKIFLNTEVIDINKVDDKFEVKVKPVLLNDRQKKEYAEQKEIKEGEVIFSKYLLLSAGGKTYPALGSNGTGYTLAEKLGHTIIHPVPSALPLVVENNPFKEISGQKLEAEVISIIDGKKVKSSIDDLMYTDYGLSGPSILNISREISIELNRNTSSKKCEVVINLFPNKSKEEVKNILEQRIKKRPNTNFQEILYGILPNKVADYYAKKLNLYNKTIDAVTEDILNILTNFKVTIISTRSWNEAEFTSGGIKTDEINQETLESLKVSNLYFAGEILDVDGDVGGFNLSWAWSSGNVAGRLI